jgi:hypothetical protein
LGGVLADLCENLGRRRGHLVDAPLAKSRKPRSLLREEFCSSSTGTTATGLQLHGAAVAATGLQLHGAAATGRARVWFHRGPFGAALFIVVVVALALAGHRRT